MTGTSIAIKAVSGPIKGTDIARGLNNKTTTDSTKVTDDSAELGKDKDGKKTETKSQKTQSEQSSVINNEIGKLGHSIPGFPATKEETKALQNALKTDPGQFGVDTNPFAKPSSGSLDSIAQANLPGLGSSAAPNVTNNWISTPNCSACHHEHQHKDHHNHGSAHDTSVVCNDKPNPKHSSGSDDKHLAKQDSPKEPPAKKVEPPSLDHNSSKEELA